MATALHDEGGETVRYAIPILLCLLSLTTRVRATEQVPNTIEINGRTYGISQFPMLGLWYRDGEDPAGRKPIPAFEFRSSANWRGYVAKFAIGDGRFWLHTIDGRLNGKDVTDSDIIPGRFPRRAHWYTGSIFVAVGDYDRKNERSRYVIEFVIDKGIVVTSKYHESLNIPQSWNGTR